jgi:phage shock protein C
MTRLYRSETNKKIAGVCGGIGEMMDVDPTIIRLATLILGLATGIFPFVIGYLIAWWIVPIGKPQTPVQ